MRDIDDSLDEGARIDAIIINFSKDLIPYYWLLTKIATSGVDSVVVVWVSDFFLGRSQRLAAATGKRGWKKRQDSSADSSGSQQRMVSAALNIGLQQWFAAAVGSMAGSSGWPQRLATTGKSNG